MGEKLTAAMEVAAMAQIVESRSLSDLTILEKEIAMRFASNATWRHENANALSTLLTMFRVRRNDLGHH